MKKNLSLFENETSFVTDLKVRIPKRVLSDILCTAFEGGSNYWLDSAECTNVEELNLPNGKPYTSYFIHELPAFGAKLTLKLHDPLDYTTRERIDLHMLDPIDDEGWYWELELKDIQRGYVKWIDKKCEWQRKEDTKTAYGFELPYIDAGSIDANDADEILQDALFMSQVFS